MDARQHTDLHYDAELKELHLKILEMGGLVEKQIEHAVRGLVDRNDELCRATIEPQDSRLWVGPEHPRTR